MKIGILSDTHDHLGNIAKAVSFFNQSNCEIILHAGDFVAPFALRAMHGATGKLIGIFGNNDGEIKGLEGALRPQDELHYAPHSITLEGKRFLLLHDPINLDILRTSGNCDVIIYGHVHKKYYEDGSPLIINPGECCGWVTGVSSVVLLDTDNGKPVFQNL